MIFFKKHQQPKIKYLREYQFRKGTAEMPFIVKMLKKSEFFIEESKFYTLVVLDYDKTYYEVVKYIRANDGFSIFAEFQNCKILVQRKMIDVLMFCNL